MTSFIEGTPEPDKDEEAQKIRRKILFFLYSSSAARVNVLHMLEPAHRCPCGTRNIWIRSTAAGSLGQSVRTATNQSLRSPRQGSEGILWMVRGLLLGFVMDAGTQWCFPSPTRCSRWGDDGEASERGNGGGFGAGCSRWRDGVIDDRTMGEGSWLQDSEMVTELSLPLRWMSDLIKVNRLR